MFIYIKKIVTKTTYDNYGAFSRKKTFLFSTKWFVQNKKKWKTTKHFFIVFRVSLVYPLLFFKKKKTIENNMNALSTFGENLFSFFYETKSRKLRIFSPTKRTHNIYILLV